MLQNTQLVSTCKAIRSVPVWASICSIYHLVHPGLDRVPSGIQVGQVVVDDGPNQSVVADHRRRQA